MSHLAVVEHLPEIGDVVCLSASRLRLARPIYGLADLAALAARLEAFQLWLHPSWSIAHPEIKLCERCAADAERGERDAAYPRRPRHKHWLSLDNVQTDRQSSAPSLQTSLAIVHGDPNLRHLARAQDGRELVALLLRVERLLGTHWRGTGGATGMAMLRGCLKRAGHPLDPLPPELRRLPPEPDYGWQRPLTEAERARKWLYVFDKHNQYLVAAQSVVLGAGAVELRAEPTFNARQAAYWHIRLRAWPRDSLLPDPTRGAGPPRDPGAYRWLTTPSVEAALSADLVEHIAAAWYWPTCGRYLQATANVLRSAIERVSGQHDRLDVLARDVLKSVYAEFLSGYLARSSLSATEDPLFRPDWRDMLKAEARTRLWYSLRPLAAAGLAPVAIATDAIYVPSDASNPDEVLAGLLTLGVLPRQWAYKRRVALSEVAEHFRDRVTSCRGLVAAVRAQESA